MFSMLSSQGADAGGSTAKHAGLPQRRHLVLQPRTKLLEAETAETASPAAESNSGYEGEAAPGMTKEEAKKKFAADSKAFFGVQKSEEDKVYFTKLPAQFHKLIDRLTGTAVEFKEADIKLVAGLYEVVASKELASPSAFEEGFMPVAAILDDIAIDAPMAFQLFVIMVKVKGPQLDKEGRKSLADKSTESDKLLGSLQ